jgi:hypothetical protein
MLLMTREATLTFEGDVDIPGMEHGFYAYLMMTSKIMKIEGDLIPR